MTPERIRWKRTKGRQQFLLDKSMESRVRSMMLLPKNLPVTQWRRLPPYSRISASSPMSQSRRPLRLLAMPMTEARDMLSGSGANASLLN
jgi:hypothetical protein